MGCGENPQIPRVRSKWVESKKSHHLDRQPSQRSISQQNRAALRQVALDTKSSALVYCMTYASEWSIKVWGGGQLEIFACTVEGVCM